MKYLVPLLLAGLPADDVRAHFEEQINAIKACIAIPDRNDRVSCVDAALAAIHKEDPIESTGVKAAGVGEIGGENLDFSEKDVERPVVAEDDRDARYAVKQVRWDAQLVGCKKDYYGRYLFALDNGQVWKQADTQRMSFKDCDFPVVIRDASLGHLLYYNGERRRVRVKRIQ